jgi:hypothetical protein
LGKRKSTVWADFEEIYVEVNGNKIRTTSICGMCKVVLSARSAAGTGHLIRHQKSCRKRLIMLLGFSLGLLLILMVLCITRTIILLWLDLSCAD